MADGNDGSALLGRVLVNPRHYRRAKIVDVKHTDSFVLVVFREGEDWRKAKRGCLKFDKTEIDMLTQGKNVYGWQLCRESTTPL